MDEYLEKITQTHFGRVHPITIPFEELYLRRIYIEDFLETCENDDEFRNYYFRGEINAGMIACIFRYYTKLFPHATKFMVNCDVITATTHNHRTKIILWFKTKNIIVYSFGIDICNGDNAIQRLRNSNFVYDEKHHEWVYCHGDSINENGNEYII